MSALGNYLQHLSSASNDALLSELRSSCQSDCFIDKTLAACFLEVGDSTEESEVGNATSAVIPHHLDGLVDGRDSSSTHRVNHGVQIAADATNQMFPVLIEDKQNFQGIPIVKPYAIQAPVSSRGPSRNRRKGSKQASKQSAVGGVGKMTPSSTPAVMQSSSAFRGVTRHRWTGRFEAHLWDSSVLRERKNNKGRRKGKQVYLGGYSSEEAAARAYDRAALRFWGTCAALNFAAEDYAGEMENLMSMTKEEMIASLRRSSTGFSRGASKYRGVTKHHMHGKWEARIGRVAGNRYLYLGTFSSEVEAARAYDRAAVQYRGEKAVTNFNMADYKHLSGFHSSAIDEILPAAAAEASQSSPAETAPVAPIVAPPAALDMPFSSTDINAHLCASLLAILENGPTQEFFIPPLDVLSPKSDASAASNVYFLDHVLP